MTAHPATTTDLSQPPWVPEPHIQAALDRALELFATDPVTEALRRTNAIVDRLCPAVPLPSFSTRYAELNSPRAAWDRFYANVDRRKALYRAIKPKVDAKVRSARLPELCDRLIAGGFGGV